MSRDPPRLTRRAVLRGAAVAGAAALVDPAPGLALTGRHAVFSRSMGSLAGGEARPIAAPARFSLVGVEWSTPARARIELRTRLGAGRDWSPWVTASVLGHGPDRVPVGTAGRFGEPVWMGPSDEVQLRSAGAVHGVRVHFVAVPGRATGRAGGAAATGASAAAALPLAQPVLDAGPGQPPIIARAAWARGQAPPRHAPEYGTVKLAFIHHSESPNGYAANDVPSILQSIFDYHRYVRGYFDIAYNFAVDAFGLIWEARAGGIDEPVIGAHAGGYNAESTGVVVLGSFMGVAPPPIALRALEQLLAWKLSLHGVPALGTVEVEVEPSAVGYSAFAPGSHISLPRVAGHRDGDQTSCPGNALYGQLPSLRSRVAHLAGGTPARLTIAAPAQAVSVGVPATAAGGLIGMNGAPLAGEPIEIQQIAAHGREITIATETTDAEGAWSFTLTAAQNVQLRALHRPAPVAVSDVAAIAVAPALTLTLESLSPLRVSGTVSAPAGPVTIGVYRVSGGGRRRVAANRVSVAGGRFAAGIKRPAPGRYVLIARTPAGARFAAGASPPLALTIP
jgi:hypothetical protein